MAHPVVWFEVLGLEGEKLRQFYRGLFGWKIETSNPMKYGMVDTGSKAGIPGGVGEVYPGTRSWVTFYVETPDVAATLDQVQRLGGKVVMPKTAMPDVTLGAFEDPEGHVIGLVEAKAG
jgi:predicted enzyme related to lactoylglutathione lyase